MVEFAEIINILYKKFRPLLSLFLPRSEHIAAEQQNLEKLLNAKIDYLEKETDVIFSNRKGLVELFKSISCFKEIQFYLKKYEIDDLAEAGQSVEEFNLTNAKSATFHSRDNKKQTMQGGNFIAGIVKKQFDDWINNKDSGLQHVTFYKGDNEISFWQFLIEVVNLHEQEIRKTILSNFHLLINNENNNMKVRLQKLFAWELLNVAYPNEVTFSKKKHPKDSNYKDTGEDQLKVNDYDRLAIAPKQNLNIISDETYCTSDLNTDISILNSAVANIKNHV